MQPQTWPELRDLIARIAGPNRSFQPTESYSQAHFDMCGGYLPGIESGQIRSIFFDTVTAATRLCFRWASAQPEALSERTGKPDLRGAYGLHAREFLLALHHLQSAQAQRRPDRRAKASPTNTGVSNTGCRRKASACRGDRRHRRYRGDDATGSEFSDGKPAQRGFVCTSPNPLALPGERSQRKTGDARAARPRRTDPQGRATAASHSAAGTNASTP
jgi:hypothetical protein